MIFGGGRIERARGWAVGLTAACVLFATGCPESAPTLVVDMRTDLSPGVEFDTVGVELYRDAEATGEPERTAPRVVASEIEDALTGVRVAEFADLSPGSWLVLVRLIRDRGAGAVSEVVIRRVLVGLRSGRQAVTVLMTRDCAGAGCPGDGDDPSETECVAGRCVSPECAPETAERCPEPECRGDSGCTPFAGAPTCAQAVCLSGFCGTALVDMRCADALQCRPEGCVDPAVPDAGPPDLSSDAGPPAPRPSGSRLAAGTSHSCFVTDPGDVYCWGDNSWGKLGDGTSTGRASAALVADLPADAVQICAGAEHTCAVLTSGELYCWGQNIHSQLAMFDTERFRRTPVAIAGLTDVERVGCGDRFTCAVLRSGEARCWGNSQFGALGNELITTTRDVPTPVEVTGLSDALEICAGFAHACALRSTGEVVCWGSNDEAHAGSGACCEHLTRPALPVYRLMNAAQIRCGEDHTCAAQRSGAVQCWGSERNNVLGGTPPELPYTPWTVGEISGAVGVAAGFAHSCALLDSGEVHCWGGGQGPTPVTVPGLSNAIALVAGDNHTCALVSSGEIRCWGANSAGQLGDGTLTDSATPVTVMGLP